MRTPPQASGRGGGIVLWVFRPGSLASLDGEGDTVVLFSQGGAGYHSLLLRRKMSAVSPSPGRFSPERKTPPGVSAPSAGLRPLSVSRVKCGGRTLSRPLSASVCGKYDMPTRRPYERIAEGLISACRKHVVAATGPSPFKVGDNQRPERTMSGAAKTSA